VLPVSAFAAGADAPVDCAQPDKTPVIRQVNGNGAPGPFVNPTVGRTLSILSEGPARVPNPAYDGPGGSQPKTVLRDHGFGACKGQVTLGGLTIPAGNVSSWSDAQITVAIPTLGFADPTTAELKVTRCEGTTTVAGITVTISSRAIDQPVRVQAGQSISDKIAAAPAGALVLVEPGSYDELVVMAKPVRLQGSGALSTVINAVKRPAEKLEQWRARIDALVAAGAIDPLPGQTFAGGGLEPTTLGTEEGAGITVLAPDVSPTAFFDPRYANRFRQSVPYTNLFPALYFTQARIDGLTVTGGDTGGGIFVNGWAHFLQITNNRVSGNEGYHHGGIRVGRPFLDLDAQAGGYGFNRSVRIANNVVTQNGALEGAEGAGVSICTGSDSYQLTDNWICGNFSQGDGGGAAHFGRSDNGQIARNRILFNQSFSQGLTKSGGGLYVAGEPAAAGGVSNGAGRNLVIDANLVQGNQAGAGHGGGIRLEYVNGGDRSLDCNLNAPSATRPNACFWVRLTNNVIVDNVAGWSGGGISLLDVAKVDIFNNTIAHNDTTATVGALFVGSPNTSTPQPAGISAERHSLGLAALVPGTANDFSNPRLVNNVLWQNRAFYYDQSNGTGLLYPNLSGAPLSCPSGADYWDLGVLDPSLRLAPTYSLLTALSQHGVTYSGPGNVSGSPAFVADYCNGARSARLAPEVTTIQVAPALDEGGNWLDVRYGPITLTGDYHLNVGSAANNIGRGSATGLVIPSTDFDGQNRPRGGGYDAGADERWP